MVDKNERSVLVALLAEGVDRNLNVSIYVGGNDVALLAEGVDRNVDGTEYWLIDQVALLAEGVDRNWMLEHRIQKRESRPPRGGRG